MTILKRIRSIPMKRLSVVLTVMFLLGAGTTLAHGINSGEGVDSAITQLITWLFGVCITVLGVIGVVRLALTLVRHYRDQESSYAGQ